jgi:hypothetical protein
MSILDDLTGLQQAAVAMGGIFGSAFTGWLVARRQWSKTNTAVARDVGEMGWIKDLKEMGRTEAKLEAAEARIEEMLAAREQQFGACEERVRSLSERVLLDEMYIDKIAMALTLANPAEAKRLSELRWDMQQIPLPARPPEGSDPYPRGNPL